MNSGAPVDVGSAQVAEPIPVPVARQVGAAPHQMSFRRGENRAGIGIRQAVDRITRLV